MSDWKLRPLAEYAAPEANTFVDGPFGSDLKVSDYTSSGVRILQLQNLGDGKFINDNVKFTSESKASDLLRCNVRPGDLIIAKMAEPLARACIVPEDVDRAVIVADLIKLRPASDVDPDFLCAAINGPKFRREAERLSTGTTRTRISLSTLKRIPLLGPTPDMQKQLGAIVRTVDEAIEQTEALIAKTQQIKAGLMHDLFTRGVTADGRLRPSREEAPQLYKESPLGWIPKEWETFVLDGSDIAIIDGDRGQHYPQSHELLAYGHCLFLSATNVTKRGFEFSSKQFITRSNDEKLRTGKLVRGDVIITTRGTVGNIAYYDDAVPFSHVRVNSGMVILRSSHPTLLAGFLYASLQQYVFDREYKRVVSGSAQPQLPIRDLKRFNVLFPVPKEQERILGRVAAIHDQIASELEACSKLRQLKHGLMYDLLTGSIPVAIESAPEATEAATNV